MSCRQKLRPSWGPVALSLAALGCGIGYLVSIPPWQSPDEPTHFEYVRVLRDSGRYFSPSPDSALQREVIASLDRHDFWRLVGEPRPVPLPKSFVTAPFLFAAPSQIGKNPPGYYIIASWFLRLCPFRTVEGELYWLRALSLLFSLGAAVLVYGTARQVFGQDMVLCLAAYGFAAFLPQFMVIGTSVSPDPLVNCLGSAFIFLQIRLRKVERSAASRALLLLVLAAGLLTSYKFLIILVGWFFVLVLDLCAAGNRAAIRTTLLAIPVALAALGIAYCALVWTVPNLANIFIGQIRILYQTLHDFSRGVTLPPPGYWSWFNRRLFRSFWLSYGWLKFEVSPMYYHGWAAAAGLSLIGMALRAARWFIPHPRKPWPWPWMNRGSGCRPTKWGVKLGYHGLARGDSISGRGGFARSGRSLVTLAIFGAVALLGYYAFWGIRVTPTTTQGRHLFITLPSWSLLFVWGLTGLVPARFRAGAGIFLLFAMLAVNLTVLARFVIPTFAGAG